MCPKNSSQYIMLISVLFMGSTVSVFAKPSALDLVVQQRFEAAYGEACDSILSGGEISNIKPTIYNLTFRYGYEETSAPPHPYKLYEFACFSGAYNQSSVYFGASEYGEIKQIFFAFPDFDVSYKDDADTIVDGVSMTGFSAWDTLTNPHFDEATQSFISHSAWRGLGDASSSGRWVFEQERFVLKTYDIDPTYDGEINAFRIYGEGEADNDWYVKE